MASLKEVTDLTAEMSGYTKGACYEICKTFIESIIIKLEEHDEVRIHGFGRFYILDKKARDHFIPNLNVVHKVPAKKYPRFAPSETLKKRVDA